MVVEGAGARVVRGVGVSVAASACCHSPSSELHASPSSAVIESGKRLADRVSMMPAKSKSSLGW